MRQHFTSLLFAFLFFHFNVSAQDPIFGQFSAAPVHLNPAMSGVFQGQFRLNLNYREQWQSIMPSTPFRTFGASFELRQRVGKGDHATFSLAALNDRAGTSHFQTSRGNLGFSYSKQLGGSRYRTNDQYLIAGAQLGMGQHTLGYQNLWFSKQFDSNTERVDPNLTNGENFQNDATNTYLDFNAGILWYALLDDNFSIYAGGSLFHINEPNISFLDNKDESLYRRWVGHIGGEIPFNKQLSLLPAVLYTTQGASRTTIFGGNLRYNNRDWQEVALRAGIWGQASNKLANEILLNALIFNAALELERWTLGLSYDVNTSAVANLSNGRGAFELSLIYVHPAKYREKVKCPKY